MQQLLKRLKPLDLYIGSGVVSSICAAHWSYNSKIYYKSPRYERLYMSIPYAMTGFMMGPVVSVIMIGAAPLAWSRGQTITEYLDEEV